MSNHTPGPWTPRHTPGRHGVPDTWCIDWSKDQEEVAEIVHGEANARLMAAAPDMLNLLRDAVYRDVDHDDEWYDKASSLVLRLDCGRKLPEKEQK